jgi:hypothetical protein
MLLTDPLTALDLRGPDGRPSHAKLASVFVGGIFLYLILREPGWPPWGQLVTFVAGLYGFRMFSLFLHRWRGSSTSKDVREEKHETKDIEERYPYGGPTYIYNDD